MPVMMEPLPKVSLLGSTQNKEALSNRVHQVTPVPTQQHTIVGSTAALYRATMAIQLDWQHARFVPVVQNVPSVRQLPQHVPQGTTLSEVPLHAKDAQQVRHALQMVQLQESQTLLLVLWVPTREEDRRLVILAQLAIHAL